MVAVGGLPENPERFVIFALKWISLPFVPAVLLAAAKVFYYGSNFKQEFCFLLFVCNLLVGSLLLLTAAAGLLGEIRDTFGILSTRL